MKQIERAAVLGAGVMGAAIAAHLANSGLKVLLLDRVPHHIDETERADGLSLESPAVRNRFAQAGLQGVLRRQGFYTQEGALQVETGNFDDDLIRLQQCDWVVEAVIEDMGIKKTLFAEQVAPNLKKGAVLTSNTSGLSVNELALILPEDVRKNFLVTHFFNPPRHMRLLELVPSRYTDPDILAGMARFCSQKLGKGIVFAKDTPNFIANRIGVFAMCNGLHHMQNMGLKIEEVDSVAGPATARPGSALCRLFDLVGIDTMKLVADNTYRKVENDEDRQSFVLPGFVVNMIERGLTGRKAAGGFYSRQEDGTVLCYDYQTAEYRPSMQPQFGSVETARKCSGAADMLKTVMQHDDPAAQFAWRNLRDTLLYTVKRIPEIADDIVSVDNGMKWGYNWSLGPFEMLDVLGVQAFVKRVEHDGLEVPDGLKKVKSFYRSEGGKEYYWDLTGSIYSAAGDKEGILDLRTLRQRGSVIESNEDASVHDLADGVLGLEFHSKMNSIDMGTLEMLDKAIQRAEQEGQGLVVANHGDVFSAGANLAKLASAIETNQFHLIDELIQALQAGLMKMKYSSVPVVAAPFNMTLGGGCEVVLHADAVCAHAETYMGLVEIGVGLIPAGGGTKEMSVRAMAAAGLFPDRALSVFQNSFDNIFKSRVSSSAAELYCMAMLRQEDAVIMNIDSLVAGAKSKVIELAQNYTKPRPPGNLVSPGSSLGDVLKNQVEEMVSTGKATKYEAVIGNHIADIMTGGTTSQGVKVSEQHLLDLEREVFLKLCGQPETLERVRHMLKYGKTLRN